MILEVLECLILTLIFECGAAYIMGIKDRENQSLIFIVNCITNPLLVLSSYLLMNAIGVRNGMIVTYAVLEPIVVIGEYFLYREKLKTRYNLFGLSLVLNIISIIGGNLCRSLL